MSDFLRNKFAHLWPPMTEILALVPANIYWKGRDGYYIGCNQQMADIFHMKGCDDVIGKSIYELMPESKQEMADQIHKADKAIMDEGKKRAYEEVGYDIEGTSATYLTTKIPIFDDEGAIVIGLLGVSIDITAKKELEKKENKKIKLPLSSAGAVFSVLLVEDDAIAEKVARLNLNEFHISLEVAKDGQSALTMIEKNHYDLILMDVGLPDTDGYTVVEKIRQSADSEVTIIGLSAHVDAEHQKRCNDVGMDAVYAKPLTRDMLRRILRIDD